MKIFPPYDFCEKCKDYSLIKTLTKRIKNNNYHGKVRRAILNQIIIHRENNCDSEHCLATKLLTHYQKIKLRSS